METICNLTHAAAMLDVWW